MSEIIVYTFEDDEGEFGSWSTQSFTEAQEHARKHSLAIKANEYEWTDSYVVEDYRPPRDDHADDGGELDITEAHQNGDHAGQTVSGCPMCHNIWPEGQKPYGG